jgi:putative aldouronate transport system permease protein
VVEVIHTSKGEKSFQFLNYIFLSSIAIVTVYPILHVLFASVSNPSELIRNNGLLLYPLGFQVESYKIVFQNRDIVSGYINTIMYVGFGTTISMTLTILGAYALSRRHAIWIRYFTFFIVFTMWFRPGMIPFFLVVGEELHMKNTLFAMILPRAISTYNLVVLRTGFAAVPESLEESARIDGAKDFQILWHIYVPLSIANIAVVALFYTVSKWNAWFDALIYTNGNQNLMVLQLLLRKLLIEGSNNLINASSLRIEDSSLAPSTESIKAATIMVATVPILMVYPFIQKYFVKGIMIGSLKG